MSKTHQGYPEHILNPQNKKYYFCFSTDYVKSFRKISVIIYFLTNLSMYLRCVNTYATQKLISLSLIKVYLSR